MLAYQLRVAFLTSEAPLAYGLCKGHTGQYQRSKSALELQNQACVTRFVHCCALFVQWPQSLSLLFVHCSNFFQSKRWLICNRHLWLCYTQASCSILCRKMLMGYTYDQAFLEANWQNCMATALQSDAPNASESTSATLRWRL